MDQKLTPTGLGNDIAQYPPYSGPKTGVLSMLPSSWIPYAQLMRLDRHGGFNAYYMPYMTGAIYAACIAEEPPTPANLWKLAVYLVPFSILLRGIACTWNDNVDQEFDRNVARCRNRPIARGAVSTLQGHVFTVAQTAAFAGLVWPFPAACRVHAVIIIALFLAYAFMKRITYYPQVFLGFPFAWAIFFCTTASGIELKDHVKPVSALVLANILWTIVYDTIYAHQDIEDDEKAGVKSMALQFSNSTKLLSTVLGLAQVALLALCGMWSGFGLAYFIGTVGGVALSMAYFVYAVDLSDPESCGWYFRTQFWVVGAFLLSGLVGEYVLRLGA